MKRINFATMAVICGALLLAACAKSTPPTTSPLSPTPPVTTPPAANTTPPVITPPANNTTPVITPPAANTTPPVTVAPAQAPGPNEVWIQGYTFVPQKLTVKAGTTVTWTNKDTDPHDVTSDPPGLFTELVPGPGGTFSYMFSTPGTYNYVCTIHPGMAGTIIVQ